jgi:hypothetical protein
MYIYGDETANNDSGDLQVFIRCSAENLLMKKKKKVKFTNKRTEFQVRRRSSDLLLTSSSVIV